MSAQQQKYIIHGGKKFSSAYLKWKSDWFNESKRNSDTSNKCLY